MAKPKSEDSEEIFNRNVKEARRAPGVVDLMKVLDEYEQLVEVTYKYFSVAGPTYLYATTDSTA